MAPFVAKQSGSGRPRGPEEGEADALHWPSLSVPKVCALSACCDVGLSSVTYPLWLLKTQEMAGHRSARAAARLILQHHGLRGLYRGYAFGMPGQLPGHCMYLCIYEATKYHASEYVPPSTAPAVGAMAAEFAYIALAMPIENVVVRVQLASPDAPLPRRFGTVAELRALWCEGGVRRLYRGGLLNLASSCPEAVTWWLIYENSKVALRGADLGSWSYGVAAVAASLASTLLVNPMDVLKTRAQAGQGLSAGFHHVSLSLFTRGLAPRLAAAFVVGLIESSAYEGIMPYGQKS